MIINNIYELSLTSKSKRPREELNDTISQKSLKEKKSTGI